MKYSVILILLTATLCPPSSTGGPYKLLAGSVAKRTLGGSIKAWAKTHSGVIASKSLTSLIGTLGLVGSIEAVCIARESAASPDDQAALDSLLSSLVAVKDSFRGKSKNPANLDGVWVSIGGLVLFSVSMLIVITVIKCCKKDNDQCDRDNAITQESPDQGKMCEPVNVSTQCEPTKAESEAIVNIETSSV